MIIDACSLSKILHLSEYQVAGKVDTECRISQYTDYFFSRTRRRAAHQYIKKIKKGGGAPKQKSYRVKGL